MFAFITLGTNDLSLSSKFYDKLLESLGIFKIINEDSYIGYAKKENFDLIQQGKSELIEFYLNSNDVEFKKVIILYEQAINNFRNTESNIKPKLLVKDFIATRNDNFYAWRCLKALGIDTDDGVIRISMTHYNSIAEVEKLIKSIDGILNNKN